MSTVCPQTAHDQTKRDSTKQARKPSRTGTKWTGQHLRTTQNGLGGFPPSAPLDSARRGRPHEASTSPGLPLVIVTNDKQGVGQQRTLSLLALPSGDTIRIIDLGEYRASKQAVVECPHFFTAGTVIFEVPTGVVADTRGRRTWYLLGTIDVGVFHGVLSPVVAALGAVLGLPWAVTPAFLGLGFTFSSAPSTRGSWRC